MFSCIILYLLEENANFLAHVDGNCISGSRVISRERSMCERWLAKLEAVSGKAPRKIVAAQASGNNFASVYTPASQQPPRDINYPEK